jgi:hypothetical protein
MDDGSEVGTAIEVGQPVDFCIDCDTKVGKPVDFRIDWDTITRGFFDTYEAPHGNGYFPDLEVLRIIGLPVREKAFSVLFKPRAADVELMKRWCVQNRVRKPLLYGRFSWAEHGYRIDRRYHGVRFDFKSMEAAVMFKMRFA